MTDYAIITDSTSDLTPEQAREHNIIVLPMGFTVGERSYRHFIDQREMLIREFYALLRLGNTAGTNAVSPSSWAEAMETELQAGRDVLAIAFSSALSSAWSNAALAAQEMREKYPQRSIEVIDSLCASMGQGLLCLIAAGLRDKDVSLSDARVQLELDKFHICHWFTVADLGHLRRGGRISRTTAVVGTALGIKPILHVDNEGRLINVDKARGRRSSIRELVRRMKQSAIEPASQIAYITHADCIEDARTLADLVRSECGVRDVIINLVGPIPGAHAGPGTLALFFLGRER